MCSKVWRGDDGDSLPFELTGILIPKLSGSKVTLQGIHNSCLVQSLLVALLGRLWEGTQKPQEL